MVIKLLFEFFFCFPLKKKNVIFVKEKLFLSTSTVLKEMIQDIKLFCKIKKKKNPSKFFPFCLGLSYRKTIFVK